MLFLPVSVLCSFQVEVAFILSSFTAPSTGEVGLFIKKAFRAAFKTSTVEKSRIFKAKTLVVKFDLFLFSKI